MPYVNHIDKDYPEKADKIISKFLVNALKYGTKGADSRTEAIALGEITLGRALNALSRLSIEVWLTILTLGASITSGIYFLGTKNVIANAISTLLQEGARK
jgi:hypothetical protein